tara:strand:+ start:700 stop:966 length:267 start_codon:yes stop_codon:yes gene_type:complete
MKWINVGIKLLPFILSCVRAVEGFLTGSGRGEEKENAAVGMVHAILQTIEAGVDKDLLNDSDVNVAVRKVMQAIVALENVVASKRRGE